MAGSDPTEGRGSRPARRSLYAFAAVAAGYAAADRFPGLPSGVLFAAAMPVLIAAMLVRGRACRVALFTALAVLAAAWFTLRIHERPADSLERLLDAHPLAEPVAATLVGTVAGRPRDFPPASGALARFVRTAPPACGFELIVREARTPDGAVAVRGRVRVSVEGAAAALPEAVRPGAAVRVTGSLRPVRASRNPGEPDRRALAAQAGLVGSIDLPGPTLIAPAEHASTADALRGAALRALGGLRRHASAALHAVSDPTEGADPRPRALLAAMLLGAREPGFEEVNDAFTRVGLVHLVAISGFNLAALAWVAMFLLRLTGDRGRLEPIGVALVVVTYLLVLPAEAPVLRAGLMLLIFLGAETAGRRYDRLTLLGWIAIVLLAWRPLDLWSLGFQLSFGIVAVLLWLAGVTQERLLGVPVRGVLRPGGGASLVAWCRERLGAAATASLLAWAVATPVVLHHTGLFSPIAPLATLIVLPLASATLCVGYVAVLIGTVAPALAGPVGSGLVSLGELLVGAVGLIDRAPGAAVRLPAVSLPWTVAATGFLLFAFARGRPRDARFWGGGIVIAAWLATEIAIAGRTPGGAALRIDTLAVGDGTCHLVRSGRDAMLWDCGSTSIASGLGDRTVPRALRALGAVRVPLAVVTHANVDHFSGLLDAAEPLGLRRVLVTRAFLDEAAASPGGAAAALIDGLRELGVEVAEVGAGDAFALGEAAVTFLSPPAAHRFRNANDTSLVASLDVVTSAGPRRLLLTGDIGPEAIATLLPVAGAAGLRADILELPHHGSVNDPAQGLVREADPRVVLQSTGPRRARDGRWEPLTHGRDWWITASVGAAWAEIRRDGTVRSGPALSDRRD